MTRGGVGGGGVVYFSLLSDSKPLGQIRPSSGENRNAEGFTSAGNILAFLARLKGGGHQAGPVAHL